MDKLLSSKPLTDKYYEMIQTQLKNLPKKPSLAIILVGDKKDSLTYIQFKRKKCDELGIKSHLHTFTEKCSVNGIIHLIQELNQKNDINGIIVQLPLPNFYSESDEYRILNSVHPEKDVDGFHLLNVGNLTLNTPKFIPCTAEGCYELLKYYQIPIKGKHIVIIGSSKVVGLPLSLLLLHAGATTTLCNIHTERIKEISNDADILISCCGVPHLIDSSWIKQDCIVIDVGINYLNQKIVGDVNFKDVIEKVKYITPVPGCIGPLTISILMKHLLL
tara:strand:+ start:162 stop:986 length:825 start_codon:yes stop_codon:yes gene_type:complete